MMSEWGKKMLAIHKEMDSHLQAAELLLAEIERDFLNDKDQFAEACSVMHTRSELLKLRSRYQRWISQHNYSDQGSGTCGPSLNDDYED